VGKVAEETEGCLIDGWSKGSLTVGQLDNGNTKEERPNWQPIEQLGQGSNLCRTPVTPGQRRP
jgi:hypothetical protein